MINRTILLSHQSLQAPYRSLVTAAPPATAAAPPQDQSLIGKYVHTVRQNFRQHPDRTMDTILGYGMLGLFTAATAFSIAAGIGIGVTHSLPAFVHPKYLVSILSGAFTLGAGVGVGMRNPIPFDSKPLVRAAAVLNPAADLP